MLNVKRITQVLESQNIDHKFVASRDISLEDHRVEILGTDLYVNVGPMGFSLWSEDLVQNKFTLLMPEDIIDIVLYIKDNFNQHKVA